MPTDWTVPEPTAMYVRASIVEQLPDPLSPLFADMIDGAVTRSLQSLFQEFLQEGVISDSDVSLPTVNGYAYYRYSRSGMGRLMWKSPPAFRMLFRGGTQDRWRTCSHPRYRRIVSDWTGAKHQRTEHRGVVGRSPGASGCGRGVLHRGTDDHPGRGY